MARDVYGEFAGSQVRFYCTYCREYHYFEDLGHQSDCPCTNPKSPYIPFGVFIHIGTPKKDLKCIGKGYKDNSFKG